MLKAIELFTGIKVTGCPWRALENPLIKETIRLFQHYESGALQLFLSEKDDEILFQALDQYVRVTNIIRSKEFDERLEEDKKRSNGK